MASSAELVGAECNALLVGLCHWKSTEENMTKAKHLRLVPIQFSLKVRKKGKREKESEDFDMFGQST